MSKTYVNAIGKRIVVDTGLDIHDATILNLYVKKPDDSSVVWTATLDGLTKLTYTTAASGDLNLAGIYSLMAYVKAPTFETFGETTSFTVYALFK